MRGESPDPELGADVVARLLAYYDAGRRDLPWRRTRDAYAVRVAEIMLQQTRVETAIPYYERWLRRFADVHALADAPLDDVYRHWEGLGDYRRARNLHTGATLVRGRHDGRVPASPAFYTSNVGLGPAPSPGPNDGPGGLRRFALA